MAYDPTEHKKARGDGQMRDYDYGVEAQDGDMADDEPMGLTMARPMAHLLGLAERLSEEAINPSDFLQRIQHDLAEQNGVLQRQHSDIEDAQKRVSQEEQRLIKLRLRTEAEIEMVHITAKEIDEQLGHYRKTQERLEKSFRE